MVSVAVCICTYNPYPAVLGRVVQSIAVQTRHPTEVLLVDNSSEIEISESVLDHLRMRGIDSRLVREDKLGLSHARMRAIGETATEWILFVDDDNELFSDYVEQGLAFILQHPKVGCFGGRLLLPPTLEPPQWTRPFLPWLGIKDGGEEVIINDTVDAWGVWEPPGAGSWVHRDVLNEYLRGAERDDRSLRLGRRGSAGLASRDDSLLMRGAYRVGRSNAYVPTLKLNHHLSPGRFGLRYLLRLMKAYGESHMLLELLLKGKPADLGYPVEGREFRGWLRQTFVTEMKRHGWRYALGQSVYHWSARRSFRELSRSAEQVAPASR